MKSMEGIDLLHVEDNEDDVWLVRECISQLSFARIVHVAGDGDDALAYLRREGAYQNAVHPSLVLLDIRIPKRSGFEVLRDMRMDPNLKHIPVVMLTTSERDQDIYTSYASGACSYVVKRVGFENFSGTLRKMLDYWREVSRLPERC